jgi:uncharacterized protein (TIGR00255 family)
MALSGMTGFARADGGHGPWTWSVEARSVNGRTLEARFRGPPGFEGLERVAREGAAARFQRGQIQIGLQARRTEGAVQVKINAETLERYLAFVEPYVVAGRAAVPSIEGLLALKGVLETGEEDSDPEARAALEAAVGASIGQCLDDLKTARLEEGTALAAILRAAVDRIEALVAQAEVDAAAQPMALKERFERRIAELVGQVDDLEARIVQEAALLAVRADVREELDRLKSHVDAARSLLASDGPVGRRLDFLSQEFNREANTLCSKSASTALTALGLELKAVIEQFREQVQNVE